MTAANDILDVVERAASSSGLREWLDADPILLAIAVGLVAVLVIDLFLGAPRWAWGGGRSFLRRRREAKSKKIAAELRATSGPQFAVLIAPFKKDRRGELGELVDRALNRYAAPFLFDRQIKVEEAPLDLAGPNAGQTARNWVKDFGADLLIWGEAGAGEGALHRLYFLTAKTVAAMEPVQEIRLAAPREHDDHERLAAGVAYIFARMALPAAREADRYRVEKLQPLLDSLGALAHDPPSGLGAAFEQVLRRDAATIALSVGRRRKDADELRRASRLRVRILAEIDRAREPVDWAFARADLGRVHLALGQLELDDKRLAAAADAFEDAITELGGEPHRPDRARAYLDLARATHERAALAEPEARYADAARHYRSALKAAPEDDPRFLDDARSGLARVLHSLAEMTGDEGALTQAIEAYRDARTDRMRAVDPERWALLCHRMGDALSTLAAKRGEAKYYERAIATYEEALKERHRDSAPLDWMTTWRQLGHALLGLGKTKPDLDALEASVTAFRNALKEIAREDDPWEWSQIQNNLGNAHQAMGEATGERRHLVSAVTAYRHALEAIDKHTRPYQWAGIQNNLGNALHALGEKSQGVDALEAALTAHRNALSVRTKETARVDWAATRNNMGLVLTTLGARLRDPTRLEEAVNAYRDAVGVFRMAGEVRYAVMAERNLDRAKSLLAESRQLAAE
ncbi:MAG: tetratricopeptide repeat protein [Maricaulaceae bacterium]